MDMPEHERKVKPEQGRALADQHGLLFFETSAKTGFNVASVFSNIATQIISDMQAQGIQTNNQRAIAAAGGNISSG